ncbi:hypothetical protein NMY22_g10836 [Coprinellus aureogranulatus]|nr:hypothetical protein NMY22_g10836 [Coprinellus aureogranulatus]
MASFRPHLITGTLRLLFLLLTISHVATPVAADGHGLLGFGKSLYKPPCAHACRAILQNSKLICSPEIVANANGTSPSGDEHHAKRHGHEVMNTEECYLQDAAFLRTLAVCLGERCPPTGVSIAAIEEYWEGHVATGDVGDWTKRPAMSYQEALRVAHAEMAGQAREDMAFIRSGEPLNVTSMVHEEDWLPENALSVAITSVFLPVLLSLFRFLPGRPLWYSRLVVFLEKPLIGHRHRTPIVANSGIMPTRGQSLYLAYLLLTQIFLSIFPLVYIYPNSMAPNKHEHYLMVIGDRTGVICIADFVALFLFSSRNNILLWITNWSHATFLLLHRWIAYCLIFEVSIHSLFLLLLHLDDHSTESKQLYWIWGIVGTFVFLLMWPASLLPIRKKAYEFFLIFHQIFAALALIATFLHIYYLFQYKWGYEIWVYVGGGIWFLDRAIRLARMVSNGYRRAAITSIDDSAEYVRVDIEGIAAEGHVYLYFPTLSWKFWENHPYSVLSSFAGGNAKDSTGADGDEEKVSTTSSGSEKSLGTGISPRTTLLVRTLDGFTKALTTRLLSSPDHRISLPVIVESSYHSNPAARNLAHCSSLLCIAGGVGITAVLPLIRHFNGVRSRLEWGVRNESLVRALGPELSALTRGPKAVEVNTTVGKRLKVADIVKQELEKEGDSGNLGVVVCGPNAMADEVREAVATLGPKAKRGVVFVDEAFSW